MHWIYYLDPFFRLRVSVIIGLCFLLTNNAEKAFFVCIVKICIALIHFKLKKIKTMRYYQAHVYLINISSNKTHYFSSFRCIIYFRLFLFFLYFCISFCSRKSSHHKIFLCHFATHFLLFCIFIIMLLLLVFF